MKEQTMERLREMKMPGLLAAWNEQQQNPDFANISFDERLGMIVDAEWLDRNNRRVARHMRAAKLKLSSACLEELDYDRNRELDKAMIRNLATCTWVKNHLSVVITGATGVGKTFLACALAQHAIRKRYRAIYRRTSRLLDELGLARADGSYVRALARFARADVLVLDDWGMVEIGAQERRDLNELFEDRYGERATIITSQLPVDHWHDHIGDPTTADAICDRLLSKSHRIMLKDPSRRKEIKPVN